MTFELFLKLQYLFFFFFFVFVCFIALECDQYKAILENVDFLVLQKSCSMLMASVEG